MATGNQNLRNLDRSRKYRQRHGQKPESTWVAETKCYSGRQKHQQVLDIMWGAGYRPGRRGTKRQDDDGQGKQPGRDLRNPLHLMAGEYIQTRSPCGGTLSAEAIGLGGSGSSQAPWHEAWQSKPRAAVVTVSGGNT